MDKYIGIDVHAASCTIAVVDAHGKRAGLHVVATNGQEIVECLAAIPGQEVLRGGDAEWLAIRGTKPNLAKVSLARKIAAIALVMWKTEEEYDSSRHSKTVSP